MRTPTHCSCRPSARRQRLSSPPARARVTARQQVGHTHGLCTPLTGHLLVVAVYSSVVPQAVQGLFACNAVLPLLPTIPALFAESRPMGEADEDDSDGAMPQLPASVHVRKSSVACSKVSLRPFCHAGTACVTASDWQPCHGLSHGSDAVAAQARLCDGPARHCVRFMLCHLCCCRTTSLSSCCKSVCGSWRPRQRRAGSSWLMLSSS